MNKWRKWPVEYINKSDQKFPKRLAEIKGCPEGLYYRGKWNLDLFEKTIAIVGSRKMTKYGRDVMERFMPGIVDRNTTVISGFMYGIDTEAHSSCLSMGGKTIAVLGGGLNWLTPAENGNLYDEILESGGLVISEYEPDFKPTLWSFPQRNRIVSALSTVGVLIVEAGLKSGSLITAKSALKQKKSVFAIPGAITSKSSEGTNWLIKNKAAKMVTELGDIFENELGLKMDQGRLFKDYSDLSDIERKIIDVLENESMDVDELTQKLRLPMKEVSGALSLMLLRDLIVEEKGKLYLA